MTGVRSLNLILMLMGALSVLMLGVVPTSAMTGAPPSCHEAAVPSPSRHEAPAPSGKAMAAMACCVSCVVTPALAAPSRDLAAHPAKPTAPVPASLPIGLSPAPEHGPPRV
ncbi:hypothetical protein [Brevundimonas sp.]|uniref:hypothetical protein n=1 Tax=Brevundimonas sp. TaxID=1871086 RepID=UPI0035677492